jgi:pimeloyl-ACP methyl ester carboxylesterase
MFASIERIAHLGSGFHSAGRRVGDLSEHSQSVAHAAAGLGGTALAGYRAAQRQLHSAEVLLLSTARRATMLSQSLRGCVETYGATENAVRKAARTIEGQFAWLIGKMTPQLLPPVLGALLIGEGLIFLTTHMTVKQQAKAAQVFLREHPRLLNNPMTVAGIRAVTMSLDEWGDGVLGIPVPVAHGVSRDAGVAGSAATVAALGGLFGLLRESPVTVRPTSTSFGAVPPRSIEQRAERIPTGGSTDTATRIRIDRYSMPGGPDRFDVYIGGTVTFDPVARKQPFDLTSNISGVAQQSPGSVRAVEQAMRAAGVTSSTPVVLNGYSQGGLVASLVASSGNYDVHGVVTFGSPAGQITVPEHVPVLELRNAEDIVPALDGDDASNRAIVVERTVFADRAMPTGNAVPAHLLTYYKETADLVDHAKSSELRGITHDLAQFGDGATAVNSTTWQATRLRAPANAGG